jgi:hypothetical protein
MSCDYPYLAIRIQYSKNTKVITPAQDWGYYFGGPCHFELEPINDFY